jgi:ClpP class serine protease
MPKYVELSETWMGSQPSWEYVTKALNSQEVKETMNKEEERTVAEEMVEFVNESVAVISVSGPMVPGHAGWWGELFGLVGYKDIEEALIYAKEEGADFRIIDYDTPGGSTRGAPEVTEYIGGQGDIYSYSSGLVASGGVFLAVAGEKFYTSKSAEVGSVGVLAAMVEIAGYLEKEGLKPRVFKSTELKSAGHPLEKMSKAQEQEIQRSVDEFHDIFVEHIAERMELSSEYVRTEVATAQKWFGDKAAEKGLTDGVMTLQELVELLTVSPDQKTNQQTAPIYSIGVTMPKKQIQDTTKGLSKRKENQKSTEQSSEENQESTEQPSEENQESTEQSSERSPKNPPVGKENQGQQTTLTQHTDVTDLIEKYTHQIVGLKVELKETSNEVNQMTADFRAMKQVLVSSIQATTVKLGSSAAATEVLMATGVSSLLQQNVTLQEQMQERFGPSGRKSTDVEFQDHETDLAAKHLDDVYLKLAKIGS